MSEGYKIGATWHILWVWLPIILNEAYSYYHGGTYSLMLHGVIFIIIAENLRLEKTKWK